MPKHTPGPWHLDPAVKPNCLAIREGPDGYLICTVWKDDSPGMMETDAQLIVAAPDLLAACEAALHAYALGTDKDMTEAINQVARAINKATDEEGRPGVAGKKRGPRLRNVK